MKQLAQDYAGQPVVFIQDIQDPYTDTVDLFHKDTFQAAYTEHGGTGYPDLPHVQLGSGRVINYGWKSNFYTTYKPLIDAEMAVAPEAIITATYQSIGSSVSYSVTVVNTSTVALSNNNAARLSVIAYEEGDFNQASHFMVRGYGYTLFNTPLASGARAIYHPTISSLSGVVNSNNLHYVALVDYKPNGLDHHWVNMQAAVATPLKELTASPDPAEWAIADSCQPVAQPIEETLWLPDMQSWTASESLDWLSVSPLSGNKDQKPVLTVDVTKLTTSLKQGTVTITALDSTETPYPKGLTVRARFTQACNADLSVTAGANPIWINKGDTFTYTLTAHNAGWHAAKTVVLTDPLPAAVSFVSASPGCSNDAGTVTCSITSLANGASQVFKIRVQADQIGTYKNTATIAGGWPDSPQTNNTSSVDVNINELSVTPNPVEWSVDSCNPIIPPVTETLSLPNLSTWSASESIPWLLVSPASGNASQKPVFSLDFSKLASGAQEGTVTITAHDSHGGTYPKDVTVRAQVSLSCNADLSIQQSASPASPGVGKPVTYTFHVHNAGPMAATYVEVVDTLPKGITFVSSSDPDVIIETNEFGQTLVLFTLGEMAPDADWTGELVVAANQAGVLSNQVAVSSSVFDSNPKDNTSILNTNVQDDTLKLFLPLLER